jgi:hypothetical protein
MSKPSALLFSEAGEELFERVGDSAAAQLGIEVVFHSGVEAVDEIRDRSFDAIVVAPDSEKDTLTVQANGIFVVNMVLGASKEIEHRAFLWDPKKVDSLEQKFGVTNVIDGKQYTPQLQTSLTNWLGLIAATRS